MNKKDNNMVVNSSPYALCQAAARSATSTELSLFFSFELCGNIGRRVGTVNAFFFLAPDFPAMPRKSIVSRLLADLDLTNFSVRAGRLFAKESNTAQYRNKGFILKRHI